LNVHEDQVEDLLFKHPQGGYAVFGHRYLMPGFFEDTPGDTLIYSVVFS